MRSGVNRIDPVKDCASQQLQQLGDVRRDPAPKVIALWPIKTVLCLKNARRKRSRNLFST
jgi:hypothetical protein